jgi:hypothetical protein
MAHNANEPSHEQSLTVPASPDSEQVQPNQPSGGQQAPTEPAEPEPSFGVGYAYKGWTGPRKDDRSALKK